MNKYAAAGLLQAAFEGKRIVVVSHTRDASRQAFRDITGSLREHLVLDAVVRSANGDERVEFSSGGEIRHAVFSSHSRDSLRGRSFDTVYLESPVDSESPDVFEAARPCLATSPFGEIIRA